ncbi:amidohydrolase, putative [Plasmodium gallinaceum]|uniref:Amidohydrolase, putative n=1 Tax=Plasmodium gallinaceum TaxID=5849 RepID=A0A1J1GXY4_PLAGA|nr:amidohydrolase, putative [Plasmodium gallinaceum]CRG97120.1 amidohydrolase, putative [Plasmodium gallinaceum]
MKTLIKDAYVWRWSNKTIENLKDNKFNYYDGEFVKRDFLIDNNKIILNFDVNNEKDINILSCKNKYIIPGLVDSHMHLAWTSEVNEYCDLSYCQDYNDIKNTLQKYYNKKRKESMNNEYKGAIIGLGYKSFNKEGKTILDRFKLDELFENNRVVILSVCLHFAVLNTKALMHYELLKYENEGSIIENVCYYKNEEELRSNNVNRGNKVRILNGIVKDLLVQDIYLNLLSENMNELLRIENIRKLISQLIKTGLTSVQTCDQNVGEIYNKLDSQNLLDMRIFHTEFSNFIFEYLFKYYNINENEVNCYKYLLNTLQNDKNRDLVIKKLRERFFFYDNKIVSEESNDICNNKNERSLFSCNRIKFFCDGSLGGKNCAVYKPFRNSLGEVNTNYGDLTEPLLLSYKLKIAKLLNLRLEMHSIGDRCADFILNEVSYSHESSDRLIIVHAQLLNKNVIEKIKKLKVIISLQPSFLPSDHNYIQSYIDDSYKECSYLCKTLMNNNIVISGGSDSPVEVYSPIKGIFDCMFRQVTHVLPLSFIEAAFTDDILVEKKKELDDNIKNIESIIANTYDEKEKLSFAEALAIYTINPAYLVKSEFFNEDNKIKLGAIEENSCADFVVLDRDISKNSEINLLTCRINQVWINGEMKYSNEACE